METEVQSKIRKNFACQGYQAGVIKLPRHDMGLKEHADVGRHRVPFLFGTNGKVP